jgi:Tfp pilus assembly protein PilO
MPKGQLERLWLGAGCVAALVMLLIGYFLFIGPQRSSTEGVNGRVSAAQLQNDTLQRRITTLDQQSKDLARYQSELAQAQLALPATSGLPDLLRTLQSIGNATLANVSSLNVGTPTDVTSLSGAAVPAAAAGSTNPANTAARLHIYALPITAQVSGSVAQLNSFLTQLQSVQPRAVLISQITQTSGTGAASATTTGATGLTLTMQAFVAPTGAVESAQLSAAAQK